jgi:hypothetical protein
MYLFRAFVESGGLMTYANDTVDLFRRLAVTIADILKGKNPQGIPIAISCLQRLPARAKARLQISERKSLRRRWSVVRMAALPPTIEHSSLGLSKAALRNLITSLA